jgi:TPR repeat protein
MIRLFSLFLWFASTLFAGCAPNTYYDISDPYAYGIRWYDRGRYDLAAQYWDPLVEKGDCDAEYWVGLLYFLGQGRPYDNEKALALWRKAANGNQPKAQGALGDIYYQNDALIVHRCKECNVERDLSLAYIWYKLLEKSARYDGEKKYAASVLKAVGAEISEQQKTRAEAAVARWKPTPRDCEPRKRW